MGGTAPAGGTHIKDNINRDLSLGPEIDGRQPLAGKCALCFYREKQSSWAPSAQDAYTSVTQP